MQQWALQPWGKAIATGLVVVGIASDVYTIVDTWTSKHPGTEAVKGALDKIQTFQTAMAGVLHMCLSSLRARPAAMDTVAWVRGGGDSHLAEIGAYAGGHFPNGNPQRIGRILHEGQVVVGKVGGNTLWYSFDGKELKTDDPLRYEVLTLIDHSRAVWKRWEKDVPKGALPAGRHQNGSMMYVGRKQHGSELIIGKAADHTFWFAEGKKEHYERNTCNFKVHQSLALLP